MEGDKIKLVLSRTKIDSKFREIFYKHLFFILEFFLGGKSIFIF